MLVRVLLLSLAASSCAARATIEQVYDIMKSTKDRPVTGGCTQEQIDVFNQQFPEAQDSVWTSSQALQQYSSRGSGAVPKALRLSSLNFMAIETNIRGKVKLPKHILDASIAKRQKLMRNLRKLITVLTRGEYSSWYDHPTQLYCDSRALQYWPPDKEMPKSDPTLENPPRLKDQPWYSKKKNYWYLPGWKDKRDGNEHLGHFMHRAPGGFVAESKPVDEHGNILDEVPYRAYDDARDNPTFCLPKDNKKVNYAWTILGRFHEAEPGYFHDVTILCPNYFSSEGTQTHSNGRGIIHFADPDLADILTGTTMIDTTVKCNEGETLQQHRPQWLTLIVEMMYQILSHNGPVGQLIFNNVITNRLSPSEDDEPLEDGEPAGDDEPDGDGEPTEDFESGTKRDYKIHLSKNIQTADQCLNVGEYERARRFSSLVQSKCIKSMQNHAYYILANYLWYYSPGHPIWERDKCEFSDSEAPLKVFAPFPDVPQDWPFVKSKHKEQAQENRKKMQEKYRVAEQRQREQESNRKSKGKSKSKGRGKGKGKAPIQSPDDTEEAALGQDVGSSGQGRERPRLGTDDDGGDPMEGLTPVPFAEGQTAPQEQCADAEEQENPNLFLGAAPSSLQPEQWQTTPFGQQTNPYPPWLDDPEQLPDPESELYPPLPNDPENRYSLDLPWLRESEAPGAQGQPEPAELPDWWDDPDHPEGLYAPGPGYPEQADP